MHTGRCCFEYALKNKTPTSEPNKTRAVVVRARCEAGGTYGICLYAGSLTSLLAPPYTSSVFLLQRCGHMDCTGHPTNPQISENKSRVVRRKSVLIVPTLQHSFSRQSALLRGHDARLVRDLADTLFVLRVSSFLVSRNRGVSWFCKSCSPAHRVGVRAWETHGDVW